MTCILFISILFDDKFDTKALYGSDECIRND